MQVRGVEDELTWQTHQGKEAHVDLGYLLLGLCPQEW